MRNLLTLKSSNSPNKDILSRYLCLVLLVFILPTISKAQRRDSKSITYEEIFDDPYDINKLFVHFQPICGELFITNINIGFGFEANYYLKNKFDFQLGGRTAWARPLDFERNVAFQNSNIENKPNIFAYFEGGATYHIKDSEKDTETKMVLYSKRYKSGNKWASKIPEHIEVPSKVRQIFGVRAGGLFFQSTTDLQRALDKQGVILRDQNNQTIPSEAEIFGNVKSAGFYIGGSFSSIKNFAIDPGKKYNIMVNDHIFNAFLDLIFAPSITLDNIVYENATFSTDQVKVSKLGGRVGMNGKFNREFGWGYGAEMGFRPSVKNRSFYILVKISFPIYGTKLSYTREAFGKYR